MGFGAGSDPWHAELKTHQLSSSCLSAARRSDQAEEESGEKNAGIIPGTGKRDAPSGGPRPAWQPCGRHAAPSPRPCGTGTGEGRKGFPKRSWRKALGTSLGGGGWDCRHPHLWEWPRSLSAPRRAVRVPGGRGVSGAGLGRGQLPAGTAQGTAERVHECKQSGGARAEQPGDCCSQGGVAGVRAALSPWQGLLRVRELPRARPHGCGESAQDAAGVGWLWGCAARSATSGNSVRRWIWWGNTRKGGCLCGRRGVFAVVFLSAHTCSGADKGPISI